jgi:hypothetical protein
LSTVFQNLALSFSQDELVHLTHHAKHIFACVQVDANGDIHRFLHDLPLTTDMVVDGLQRPLLPFFGNRENLFRDSADRAVRNENAVNILDMGLNIIPLVYMDRIFSSIS